jgi:hypothetical protein
MSIHMGAWPIHTDIHAGFEKEFPATAKKLRKVGIGVYKSNPRAKKDMLGFPVWRTAHWDHQLTGYMRDTPDKPYTRERVEKRIDRFLSRFRKAQREIAGMTIEERIRQVGEILDDNIEWAARQPGGIYNAWISAPHDSGDKACTLEGRSAAAWLWGIGQVCACERNQWSNETYADRLVNAYREKQAALGDAE